MQIIDTRPRVDFPVDSSHHRVGLFLVPGFALMSYSAVVEPLRAANMLSGFNLYSWQHLASGEEVVKASSGVGIIADSLIGAERDIDTLFVVASGNPTVFDHKPTFSWLRRMAKKGVRMGGISGGPFILARAGVLGGYRCTIHWEHAPAFREAFPNIELTRGLFEIDRNRLTCAGGIAALDMMHVLIAAMHGHALANGVNDWFLQTQTRAGGDPQRLPVREQYGVHNAKLLRVLELIEQQIEEPIGRARLAEVAGVSVRQLDRLFREHIGTSLNAHYANIRLERARLLLRQTALSIIEVALATGYKSASHFSRSYGIRFGRQPRTERLPGAARTRP